MKSRKIFWIVCAVVLVHGAVFFALSGMRPLPKRAHVPRPTFVAAELATKDPDTGEAIVIREFTVSTRLTPAAPTMETRNDNPTNQ